jgi:hypothetical protein
MRVKQVTTTSTQVSLPMAPKCFSPDSTPVAALVPGKGWMRTEKTYSVTTTKHINRWPTENASTYAQVAIVPQWDLDQLVAFEGRHPLQYSQPQGTP